MQFLLGIASRLRIRQFESLSLLTNSTVQEILYPYKMENLNWNASPKTSGNRSRPSLQIQPEVMSHCPSKIFYPTNIFFFVIEELALKM